MMAQAKQVYQIYPIPQVQHAGVGQAAFSSQVNIVAEPGIDAVTIDRARQVLADHGLDAVVSTRVSSKGSNLLLGVNGSKGVVDQRVTALRIDRGLFTLAKYDRHILSLTADKAGGAQVVILGENTDAVFCGLASLEQMLDQCSQGRKMHQQGTELCFPPVQDGRIQNHLEQTGFLTLAEH